MAIGQDPRTAPARASYASDRFLKPASFDVRQARHVVADLFEVRPWIYWTDWLLSFAVGLAAASVYLSSSFAWPVRLASFLVAGFALYRTAIFMHEIVHFSRGIMRPFTVVWNATTGVALLMPSHFYLSHISHHNTRHYGTWNDGEYLPRGVRSLRSILDFLAQIVFLPAFVFLRHAVLTPVSALHPRIRRWVLERASSFVINFRHRREIPSDAPTVWWWVMDIACCLRAWLIIGCIVAGLTDWTRIPLMYGLAMFTLGMNHFRTLLAHRYLSGGHRLDFQSQFFDSTSVTGSWSTELVCPLGLRYHALHHLFPGLPYHNLGRAHRRLLAELPEDSGYREVLYPSLWAVLRELLGWNAPRACEDRALQERAPAA